MTDTIAKQTISADLAMRMLAAAAKKADEIGKAMVIYICDEAGVRKAALRMDGAPYFSNKVGEDKARTSASFGAPTHMWHDNIKDDPQMLTGVPHIPGFSMLGGGYPIMVGDQIIGGIGVSGGHYEEDMACAEAALALIG